MLYLLKSGNYLKIGYAKNIEERMKLYTTHNPDFELLDTAEGTLLDEKELHKVCKRWQHRTEWYDYNEEVIKIFKEFTTRNKSEVIFKFLIQESRLKEIALLCTNLNKTKNAGSYSESALNFPTMSLNSLSCSWLPEWSLQLKILRASSKLIKNCSSVIFNLSASSTT